MITRSEPVRYCTAYDDDIQGIAAYAESTGIDEYNVGLANLLSQVQRKTDALIKEANNLISLLAHYDSPTGAITPPYDVINEALKKELYEVE